MTEGPWKLPKGWHWVKLDEVGDLFAGTPAPQNPAYFEGGKWPFVRVQDLGKHGRTTRLADIKDRLNEKALKECSLKLAEAGTILFPKSGAAILTNSRAILGVDAYIVSHLAAVEPDSSKAMPQWVYFWLCMIDMKGYVDNPAYPSLRLSKIKNISLPLPPLPEQRRIVAKIEALFERIREAKRLRAEARKDADTLIEAALGEVFKHRDGWQKHELRYLVAIQADLVDPTSSDYRDLPHISGSSIKSVTGQLQYYRTAAKDGVVSSKYFFSPGNVLYSKIRPYLRKATLVSFTGLCSADVYPLKVVRSDKLMPEFLRWVLVSQPFTEYATMLSGRARMPKLNREQLLAYPISLPALTEQRRIVAYLDSVAAIAHELKQRQEETDAELQRLEQTILDRAFRGEL